MAVETGPLVVDLHAASAEGDYKEGVPEVANGFVKDGSSLPYVFETSESGWFTLF